MQTHSNPVLTDGAQSAPPEAMLLERYDALEPGLRQREAAKRLGVSEGALVEAFASARGQSAPETIRLGTDWDALLHALPRLGKVMALTRNAYAVIEKSGNYGGYERFGMMANVIADPIDLRLLFRGWHAAYAVKLPTARGTNPSIQVFDKHGDAAHKVFLGVNRDAADYDTLDYDTLVAELATESQPYSFVPAQSAQEAQPDDTSTAMLKRASLIDAWSELKDTHDFFPMLKKLSLDRHTAVKLADGVYTRRVQQDAYAAILEGAAESGLSIMVFVSSRGVVEIHTGPVHKVKRLGDWFNVMDPDFNLHLDERGLEESWVVTKPTVDGDVNSLEVYDAGGNLAVQFFGARKPGVAESTQWRALLQGLDA